MTVQWRTFFFFQAEDGIRDYKVTGVQTCALPISHRHGDRVDGAALDVRGSRRARLHVAARGDRAGIGREPAGASGYTRVRTTRAASLRFASCMSSASETTRTGDEGV